MGWRGCGFATRPEGGFGGRFAADGRSHCVVDTGTFIFSSMATRRSEAAPP
jgi:hypothetical protein